MSLTQRFSLLIVLKHVLCSVKPAQTLLQKAQKTETPLVGFRIHVALGQRSRPPHSLSQLTWKPRVNQVQPMRKLIQPLPLKPTSSLHRVFHSLQAHTGKFTLNGIFPSAGNDVELPPPPGLDEETPPKLAPAHRPPPLGPPETPPFPPPQGAPALNPFDACTTAVVMCIISHCQGLSPAFEKGEPREGEEGQGQSKGKSKSRQVEEGGEPEEEAVEESTAGAGGETFMAVRSSSESRAVGTADLVSSRDSYRVESVRILKPPGDECFTWPVDSGATCHIVASRFLECYRVVRKHQGTTTLTGANGMPIAVQGICDLEVRIGKEKISLGSVVIADIDFNVLSCFWMQEHGWRTVLGAKNSYVVKGKMRFPIQMAERAWWMTVTSTRKDNGVKPRTLTV